MSFAPRVMLNLADVARTRPRAAGQPRELPLCGRRRRGRQVAAVQRLGRRDDQEAATCAACALESFETGRPEMRQTLDRAEKFLNLVALLAALLAPWRWRWPRAISRQPSRRLRHAARAGPDPAHASPAPTPSSSRSSAWSPASLGVALGFARALCVRRAAGGLVERRCLAPGLWPVALRPRHGADAAVRLRPAAGAAAGARAAAARDAARRRHAQAGIVGVLGIGVARLRGAAAWRPAATSSWA